MPRLLRILVLLSLACAAPALALEAPPESRTAQRLRDLRAESVERPADPTPHYLIAYYLADSGDQAGALHELDKVAQLGDGFLPDAGLFAPLAGRPEYQQLMQRFTAALPRTPDAPLAFTVPDAHLVPEGIAHDVVSGDFFLGSGPQHRIVRIKPSGEVSDLSRSTDGLLAVLGLAVDAEARRLYAVTSDSFGYGGGDTPANRIVCYDLARYAKVADWSVAGAKGLNDVTIAADGVLFASDSDQGMVWRIDTARGTTSAFVPPDTFYGINGLAASADRRHLYVAHSMGVTRISLADGTRTRIKLPERQTIAGMDGMYFWQGNLLGIQNVTSPGRVICVRLAPDGVTATAVETLQSHHHPLFDTPTTGTVAKDGFYVLARTQIGTYDPAKGFTTPDKFLPPAVIRVPLPKR